MKVRFLGGPVSGPPKVRSKMWPLGDASLMLANEVSRCLVDDFFALRNWCAVRFSQDRARELETRVVGLTLLSVALLSRA